MDLYDTGERPIQETRHWDEEAGRTRPGRSKENEEDYRYFPEPDLTPLVPTAAEIAAIDASIPELPGAKRSKVREFLSGLDVSLSDDDVSLVVGRGQVEFLMEANGHAAGVASRTAVSHPAINTKIWSSIKNIPDLGQMSAVNLAELSAMVVAGDLSSNQGDDVLAEMVATGGTAADIAAAKGFEAMDTGELEGMLDDLISNHADQWARFCGDDEGDSKKMAGFFTGQIMKATRGQADGKVVAQLLDSRRGGGSVG
ncbi:MAG: aspartyl-tRNA(Asn)/glutamyl-tRNA(Gln) amidotransferase subunit B [Verrucomicrobiales bacterium]